MDVLEVVLAELAFDIETHAVHLAFILVIKKVPVMKKVCSEPQ